MEMSARLKLIAGFVTEGYVVADIGTDHGYIPIWLIKADRIPRAIAMDIGKGPLERAQENIKQYGYEDRIETRLSDGLKELRENEADSVVIAGMGGPLIVSLLEAGKTALNTVKELILSPHTDIYLVRHYLIENGYDIVREEMVYDMGKYYTVMKAVHTEDKRVKSLYDRDKYNYIYGRLLLMERSSVFMGFIKNEKDKLSVIFENLSRSEGADEKKQEIRERLKYINGLEEIHNGINTYNGRRG